MEQTLNTAFGVKEPAMKSNRSLARARRSRPWLEELEPRRVLSGPQPTAAEQLLLEQLNNIRADPTTYGTSINVNLSGVAPAPPLAFDPTLIEAAQMHSQDMNANGYFSKVTPGGLDLGGRLNSLGFSWVSFGESIDGSSSLTTSASALQDLITDASSPTLADRNQLLAIDALYQTQDKVGIGIVQGGNGPLANYYTIDTAATTNGQPILTGVVFNDAQGTGQYAMGEGLGHVLITVTGPETLTTVTWDSGGYSLQLNPGTYTVTASGGALTAPISHTVTLGITNARLNFALPATALQAGTSAWLVLLYHDILGRTPSAGEVNGWVSALQGGMSRQAVASAFANSQEYSRDLVTQWYGTYLQRAPDTNGLTGFTNQLVGGASEDAVREAILGSQEFFTLHGGTATGFVAAVYLDVLGRLPSGSEANGWIAMASSASGRTTVVTDIMTSNESMTREVTGFYNTFLRRNADGPGLSAFVSMLAKGSDERAIVPLFISSAEYFSSAQAILWLQGLYNDVLGRSGDNAAELGGWLSLLRAGAGRSTIAAAIAGSAEADTHIVSGLYERLLGRAPDAPGLGYFVHLLQTGSHVTDVVNQIVSSQEYFNHQGGTNALFVSAIYRDLLFRAPINIESSAAINALNTGETRLQVVVAIANTLEYQQDYINSLFQLYLRRPASATDLSQYVAMLTSGSSDAAVVGALLGSDEYYARFAG
jgi:hypothetical protein